MSKSKFNKIQTTLNDYISKMNVEGLSNDILMGYDVEEEIIQLESKVDYQLSNSERIKLKMEYNEMLLIRLANFITQ